MLALEVLPEFRGNVRTKAGDGLFDWSAFQVSWTLRTDLTGSPCGELTAGLAVRGDHAVLTDVKPSR